MNFNSIADKVSYYNRNKKYQLFLEQLHPCETDMILDAGFSNIDFIPAENFLEKNYPYLQNITALGIDGDNIFKTKYSEVKTVLYDGNIFPFKDKIFDIGWSNAVLEHVGGEEKQILFLKELYRTCKHLYFTTPNRFFPFELHTKLPLLHWLPKKIFDKLLLISNYATWAAGDYLHLLSYHKLKKLLKKAGIENYKIHRNRFWGFTMDFSIVVKPISSSKGTLST
jgi:SAM-dependent methyltransferase